MRTTSSIFAVLTLALSAAAPACSGASSPGFASSTSADTTDDDDGVTDDAAKANAPVQMNDVTVVLPLATTATEFKKGYLPATAKGVGGALLPKALYEGALPPSTTPVGVGGQADMAYADLRVVAVRFDPCFANVGPVTDPSSCENQLRVVFQSLSFAGGQTTAMDGAVHAFYSLTRAEFLAAVEDVAALRAKGTQAGDLGPLAPHPLLVSQGLDGAFGKALQKVVLKYAGASDLIRFTHFMGGNLSTSWSFVGFDVADGATTPMGIPTLPGAPTSVDFFVGFGAPMAGGFTPETESADDISVLVNIDTAKAATASARSAAYDAALRIQNPDFDSPNTIDCASCHAAQAAQVLMGDAEFHLSASSDKYAFSPNEAFVSAADTSATTNPATQPDGFNVHMLSYKGASLMIGQRVINETASIVAYVNGTILRPAGE